MDELERLLQNWGRWAREGSNHRNVSSTLVIINRLKLYSKGENDEEQAEKPISCSSPPPDEADAIRVDKAFCQLPSIRVDDRQGRDLLRTMYLKPWVSFPSACQRVRVSTKKGRELMEKARQRLGYILDSESPSTY